MVVQTHPQKRGPPQRTPEFRLVEVKRRHAKLHLFTYLVGNLLFWMLLGPLLVSADPWYWWPILPLAGWTLVLTLHLWHAYRS